MLVGVVAAHLDAAGVHPGDELGVINDELLKRVAVLVHEVDMHVLVAGVHLAATLVHGQEHGLDAAGGLRQDAGGAGGRDGEASDVATAVFDHHLIQFGVGLAQTADVRIVLLALGVENLKCATLLGHDDRRAVGGQRQCLVNRHRECGGLIGAVAQTHSGNHVALGCGAHAGAAALQSLGADFVPQVQLGALHLVGLGVFLDFCYDGLNLLHLQVDDVVHHALCARHMLGKEVEIETGVVGKRVAHITVEVDGYQAATVVRTQWNLATGVGGDGAEAQVGIAVGHRLANDGVPEQDARLGALPRVVHDFVPQLRGVDFFLVQRVVTVDGISLGVLLAVDGSLHKLIVDAHTHVGAGHLALGEFGVDKRLRVGVLDAHGEHQGATATVLRHLARAVAVALHEGHQACRGEGGVFHRRALGADVRQVMAHATTAFHELHLLLVDLYDATVGVGLTVDANHKAVAQRTHLEVVADACHGAALRHDVAEMTHQVEQFLLAQGVGILLLDAGNLASNAVMHIVGRTLIDVSIRVFQGILAGPHTRCEFIAFEIL